MGITLTLLINFILYIKFCSSSDSVYVSDLLLETSDPLSAEISSTAPENCTKPLENFTSKIIALSNCTVNNARPFRVCMNCEKEIDDVEKAYDSLRNESDCKQFYFESDQIRIIDVVFNLWETVVKDSNCQDCYRNRNDAEQYFNLSNQFEACVHEANETSGGAANITCEMCQELFAELNKLYNEFVSRIGTYDAIGVCMDIVDKMNITRQYWASQDCVVFDFNIGYPNIVTAVLIGAMPVAFYLLSKNISIIEDVRLVRPKRKSFSAPSSE